MKGKYENGPYGKNMGCALDLSALGWRLEAGSCRRDSGPYGSTKMRSFMELFQMEKWKQITFRLFTVIV